MHSSLPLPSPSSSTLFVIDLQERLIPAMPATRADMTLRYAGILLELFQRRGGDVVVTQQYPRGLGPTVPAIEALIDPSARRFDKRAFSALREPLDTPLAPRSDVVVCGMETHVCVLQTAFDLLARGHRVWVADDAVASRTEANRESGLALMTRAGAIATNTETLVFAALASADDPDFKHFSAAIR